MYSGHCSLDTIILSASFKTSANCYPWKQMMFLLGRSDLKGFPPMKTTGGRWKVWGATAEKVVLFLWLKCTLRARLKCYLLTSSARLCGVRVVKPGRLSVCLFLSNKGCLFKTVWWSEKKKGSTFKNSSVNCVWTKQSCVSNLYISSQMYMFNRSGLCPHNKCEHKMRGKYCSNQSLSHVENIPYRLSDIHCQTATVCLFRGRKRSRSQK